MTPDTEYQVDTVWVDGINQGSVTNYTFTNVQTNHTITVIFKILQYTITVSTGPNGTINPSTNVSLNYGANQGFTITPGAGYQVDTVLVDGVNQGSLTSYAFTNVQTNHTISASFKPLQFTITSSAGANGSINLSGKVPVNYGANQSFTISPYTGYHISMVLVDGANQGAVSSYTFYNVLTNHTITATFAANTYNILVTNTVTASSGSYYLVGVINETGTVNSKWATVTENSGSPINNNPTVSVLFANVTASDTITVASSANITIISQYISNPYPTTNTSDYSCSATISLSDFLANPSGYVNVTYSYPGGSNNPFTLYGTYSIILQ